MSRLDLPVRIPVWRVALGGVIWVGGAMHLLLA
jgi:hypothetical protein